MSRLLAPAAVAASVLLFVLTGCVTTSPVEPTPGSGTEVPSESPAESPSESVDSSVPALCDLVSLDEAGAILAGSATISSSASFGDLTSEFGGQCIWSTDPSGDIYTDDVRVLELIAFAPGSANPAPPEAPALGSGAVVETDSGFLFAGTERIFWFRLTGAASFDAAGLTAARDLIPTILGRV